MGNNQIQRLATAENPKEGEWEPYQLDNQPAWEHTKALTLERVNEDLREVFYDRDASRLVDSPETFAGKRNRSILRRQLPFVALVNDKGEFKRLVDRQALLDQVAVRLGEESDAC